MRAPDSRAACNGIAAAPRARSSPELQTWSGRTIDVPSAFISGKQDWGTYQRPGVFEAMQSKACTNMIGCHLVDGAGHWVQQEQPARSQPAAARDFCASAPRRRLKRFDAAECRGRSITI